MRKEDIELLAIQVEIQIPRIEELKKLLLENTQPLRSDMGDALHYMLSTKQVREDDEN